MKWNIIQWLDRIFSQDEEKEIVKLKKIVKDLDDALISCKSKYSQLLVDYEQLKKENEKLKEELKLFEQLKEAIGEQTLKDLIEYMNV